MRRYSAMIPVSDYIFNHVNFYSSLSPLYVQSSSIHDTTICRRQSGLDEPELIAIDTYPTIRNFDPK
jgi:hypothetical protein